MLPMNASYLMACKQEKQRGKLESDARGKQTASRWRLGPGDEDREPMGVTFADVFLDVLLDKEATCRVSATHFQ
jgi:hypothetical protein